MGKGKVGAQKEEGTISEKHLKLMLPFFFFLNFKKNFCLKDRELVREGLREGERELQHEAGTHEP